MENMYYTGLDVHKKTISYCVKDGSGSGRIYAEAEIPATRLDLAKGCCRTANFEFARNFAGKFSTLGC